MNLHDTDFDPCCLLCCQQPERVQCGTKTVTLKLNDANEILFAQHCSGRLDSLTQSLSKRVHGLGCSTVVLMEHLEREQHLEEYSSRQG